MAAAQQVADPPVRRDREAPAAPRRILHVAAVTTACLALLAGGAVATGAWPSSPAGASRPAVAPPPVTAPAPPTPSAARTDDGVWPATGALFDGTADAPGAHFCSASVVSSASGDVLMTAAHCLADGDGTPADLAISFAPGYRDGVAPEGYWNVTSVAVSPAWSSGADPDEDVAFLTVSRDGSPPIQQVTGGYDIAFDGAAATTAVTAVGYNDDAEEATTTSGTTTTWSTTQLRLAAPGLSDGTSGGPWLTGPDDTRIIGVTGGYQQGGDTPDVSFAPTLGPAARSVYEQADDTT